MCSVTDGDVMAAVVSDAADVSPKIDTVLAAAVDLARAAAEDTAGTEVGEHLRTVAIESRVVAHEFAATVPGYRGWHWSVTVARAPRSKTVTVDEVVLLPGPGALLAQPWVPWQDRIRPDDLGPGDLLPKIESDPRLVPAYLLSDDPAVEAVAFELGLGRVHVMSRDGRLDAAERWLAGDAGPDTAMARQAPARCGTCGFYLPIEGSLRAAFGVCGNEMTPTDAHVVSVEFGCGAHSEAGADPAPLAEPSGEVYRDGDVVV